MGNKEKLEKAKVNMGYKERLEKAKELYPTANADQRYVLECLFPELAESEDERIRKEIIEFVDINTLSVDERHDRWIAWLEKQGVQEFAEKVESKFKVKYAGNEYNVLDVKENMGITWYGIEDEPNHIDYVKANSCEIISGYAIKENGSPYPTKIAVFSEQKPTDEDMKEALRTEYEKGRADVIADTLSWLANVWPQYCSNPNIIDAYKEGVVKD